MGRALVIWAWLIALAWISPGTGRGSAPKAGYCLSPHADPALEPAPKVRGGCWGAEAAVIAKIKVLQLLRLRGGARGGRGGRGGQMRGRAWGGRGKKRPWAPDRCETLRHVPGLCAGLAKRPNSRFPVPEIGKAF